MIKRVSLILARHTETDWNVADRYSGQDDTPVLSELGRGQARGIGSSLSGLTFGGFASIISSDLRRAVQTAREIKTCLGQVNLCLTTDRRLREVSLGLMDGLTKAEAREKYKDDRYSTRSPNFDFSPLGGEKRGDVLRRHLECLEEIVNMYGSHTSPLPAVIVVGHGTALRVVLESLGKGSLAKTPQGGFAVIESYPF